MQTLMQVHSPIYSHYLYCLHTCITNINTHPHSQRRCLCTHCTVYTHCRPYSTHSHWFLLTIMIVMTCISKPLLGLHVHFVRQIQEKKVFMLCQSDWPIVHTRLGCGYLWSCPLSREGLTGWDLAPFCLARLLPVPLVIISLSPTGLLPLYPFWHYTDFGMHVYTHTGRQLFLIFSERCFDCIFV